MTWQHAGLTHQDLDAAMRCCEEIGVDAFRRHCHGNFQAARGKRVMYEGRGPFEPRPLIATAYALCYPQRLPLSPKDFTGDSARQYLIRHHGFTLEGEMEVEGEGAASAPSRTMPPRRSLSVTIDGQAYPVTSLSRDALETLAMLRRVDHEIARISQRLGILHTAREQYAQALTRDLPDRSGRKVP